MVYSREAGSTTRTNCEARPRLGMFPRENLVWPMCACPYPGYTAAVSNLQTDVRNQGDDEIPIPGSSPVRACGG